MVVAMACTENWYHYLTVDVYSLLKTTKAVKKIYLLLETDNIDDIPELKKVIKKYPVELKIINFNDMIDNLIKKESVNRDTKFSNFTFARLALPSIVEEDRVLYIDTDAIVLENIEEIWDIDIDDYYLAGCKDYGAFKRDDPSAIGITDKYLNAGVLLMNIKKMKKDDIEKKCFELLNKLELLLLDQDALNLVCQHNELYISNEYNYAINVTENHEQKKIKIIHYAGSKTYWIIGKKYAKLWYDVERKFFDEFGN